MGTNYYATTQEPCEHCGGSGNASVHIGKSSNGWKFLFNPFRKSFKEWMEVLKSAIITDEYGRTVDYEEFKDMVVSKQSGVDTFDCDRYEDVDEDGYRISKSGDFS